MTLKSRWSNSGGCPMDLEREGVDLGMSQDSNIFQELGNRTNQDSMDKWTFQDSQMEVPGTTVPAQAIFMGHIPLYIHRHYMIIIDYLWLPPPSLETGVMVIESINLTVWSTVFSCDINKPQHTLYMSVDSICVYACQQLQDHGVANWERSS